MSEKSVAQRLGAKLQNNSGRGQYAKGDARWGPFLVDFKEYSKSFSVNVAGWAKVVSDAMRVDKSLFPAINVILGEEGQNRLRLWVIDEPTLKELTEAWEFKQEWETEHGLR